MAVPRATRARRLLVAAVAALAAGHLLALVAEELAGFSAAGLLTRLDLSAEQSVGTWFTSGTLAAGAVLAVVLALVPGPRLVRRGWVALAAFLALLSLDEVAGLHEWAGEVIPRYAGDLPPVLEYAWVVPAVIILALFVAWQRRFLAALPRPLTRRLAVALVLYAGGAVGLEVVEGVMHADTGQVDAAYLLVAGVEETLEVAAAALLVLALLRHLAVEAPAWRVELAPGGVAVRPEHGPVPERRAPARRSAAGRSAHA
jgi:hypothetical protein